MKGRIGEKHTETCVFAQLRKCIRTALFEQDNRPARAFEQRGLFRRYGTEHARRIRMAAHHGERLCLAALALAQPPDGFVIPCVAREVYSAASLHRNNFPPGERLLGESNGIARKFPPVFRAEVCPRPADGTAVRLRVVAPGAQVPIVLCAVGTHGKGSHRRIRPIIWNVAQN